MKYDKIIDRYITASLHLADVKGIKFCSLANTKTKYPVSYDSAKDIIENSRIMPSHFFDGILAVMSLKYKKKYSAKCHKYEEIFMKNFNISTKKELVEFLKIEFNKKFEKADLIKSLLYGRIIYNMGYTGADVLDKLCIVYSGLSISETDDELYKAFRDAEVSIINELIKECDDVEKYFYKGQSAHIKGNLKLCINYMKQFIDDAEDEDKLEIACGYIISSCIENANLILVEMSDKQVKISKEEVNKIIKSLKEVTKFHYMTDEIYVTISKIYMKMGEYEKALNYIKIALDENKNNIEALMMEHYIKKII